MSDITVEEFRAEARAWLAGNAPLAGSASAEGEPGASRLERDKALQAKIFDAGFAGITWPVAYGGRGLTDEHQLAWNEEAAPYEMPQIYMIGHGMCGPTILDLGTEEQKQRYIAEMLRGQVVWCQMFSEPGAGSDVASLSTRAERDGDEWVINGQKVWTSGAQFSDHGILIARTDPSVPKHNGITMFILDIKVPEIDVRPLRVSTGEAPFNEVYFTDVRIPADRVVGEVNAGWAAAVLMLRHERISIGTSARPPARPLSYDSVLSFAKTIGRTDDTLVRDRLAYLYSTDTAGSLLAQRMRQEVDAGQELRARGSIAKLAGAAIGRGAVDVVDEVGGADVIAWDGGPAYPPTTHGVVGMPAGGIAGGSNEIQRGIIGERVLGLAKDPQLDREVPYNELRNIALPKAPTR
ncbi:MAG: acyl-CoA dehydrogenase family protein [Frankiaceae bacterium]|jgi:alkylation response protein AidB-like acyl-CoA dehydrogenase|nr:acyl-CoA dehydrogenase family protein [Frankiaceae bacterium]